MAQDIQSVDWMTPKTKEQALIKLHAVANKIGTKEHWIDYSKVPISRGDAYGNSDAHQPVPARIRNSRKSASRWIKPIGR